MPFIISSIMLIIVSQHFMSVRKSEKIDEVTLLQSFRGKKPRMALNMLFLCCYCYIVVSVC